MSIDEVFSTCSLIANKQQRGYFTGEQFNLLAPLAQLAVIDDLIGNQKKYSPHDPTPPYGFNLNQKVREVLRPLMKLPTTYVVTTGVVAFPADYLYADTMVNAANGKIIIEATEDEVVWLNNSQITPPTTVYPKYVLHSNGFNIYPTTGIANIKLSYVRKPITPFWNFTINNDRQVYDPSGSQDFEITDTALQLQMVMKILSKMGMNLTMPEVVQFAAMEAQTG